MENTARTSKAKGKFQPLKTDLPLKSVTVKFGMTFNPGNYESMRVDLELTADVPHGVTTEQATQNLYAQCVMQIQKRFQDLGSVADSLLEQYHA